MRLKQLRLNENKSQSEFAKIFNLTQGTYSNYENNTTEPPIKTLIEIADYYNVSLDYLVGRQFANDVGYLSDSEKSMLEIYRNLSAENQRRYLAEGKGMLLAQS